MVRQIVRQIDLIFPSKEHVNIIIQSIVYKTLASSIHSYVVLSLHGRIITAAQVKQQKAWANMPMAKSKNDLLRKEGTCSPESKSTPPLKKSGGNTPAAGHCNDCRGHCNDCRGQLRNRIDGVSFSRIWLMWRGLDSRVRRIFLSGSLPYPNESIINYVSRFLQNQLNSS